jgi:putative ABC transport system substrate-binding protein
MRGGLWLSVPRVADLMAPLYVDRILKGTKPADLPVELPTKVEFLINLRVAKTLGVEVPLSLLIRAETSDFR